MSRKIRADGCQALPIIIKNIYQKLETEWKPYSLVTNTLDEKANYCIGNSVYTNYIGGQSKIAGYNGIDWEEFTNVTEVTELAVSENGKSGNLIGKGG